ncbi:kunitz-type protease inhibitor 1 isoform X4 [Equus przewalskii]|uniref:Kunitz-type protease inhibitor 1 n=2 Tax=Equus TaxID=9789 RepID=A0A3Q2IDK1_HORSE|nr:kunitz-type protease inhibitor 1 isoform X4 [Equus caballus]
MASASHSGRKEGFLELARAGTLEQASRIPLIKGAATQLLGSLPATRWKCFPRADADGEIVCIGLSPKSPPPAPSPAPQAWGWKRGPDQKGRQEATRQIARPSRARRRGSFPAGSGPPSADSVSPETRRRRWPIQRTGQRGGSGGPSRAGRRDRNLGRPGPTPLTCAGLKHPWGPEARTVKVTPVGRRATAPGRMMAGAHLSQALIPAVLVWLLCELGLRGTQAGQPPEPPGLPAGPACLDRFTAGVPDFVLDTEASVSNGATFLGSPTVRRGWDCVRACCTTQNCNLALVELHSDGGEDAIATCFLMDCLYEQNFVCKFAPREGFINYLTREVYRSYRELRTQGFGGSGIPRIWAGVDLKVQPQEPLVLKGVGTTDWHLLQGDTDVRVEKNDLDQVELWGLKEGAYLFQLRAGSDQPDSTTNITITVLSAKQTEEYCLASSKVGRCRGSFPRWYYDPTEQICKSFVYGGCLGNKNNYLREEECKLACRDVQGPSVERHHPVCSGTCPSTKFRCSDGCCIDSFLECDDTPDCPDASDEATCDKYTSGFEELQNIHFRSDKGHCVDLPDTGLCLESIPRWYYNPFSERCARFTYGGCYGNKNNFEEEQQCLESCRGISKKDVFGLRRESHIPSVGSVEVAVAVLLVTCIVVVVAILGYCFIKNQRKSFHRHHHRRPPPPTPTSSTVSTTEDTEHLVYNHTTRPL